MRRITSVLRKGFHGWSLRPVRGKAVTVRFQDRSVAVVARDVVGYARPDTVASRFAQAYHARWPSVRLDAFGAAARRMRVTAEAARASPVEPPARKKIDDPSPETVVSFTGASSEVNPTYEGNEGDGVSGAAKAALAEPGRASAGARISPHLEDTTIEDAEAEACPSEPEDRMTEEDMADLVEVDPPEFPEDGLEEEEEDEFRLR